MTSFLPAALAVVMIGIHTPALLVSEPDASKKKLAITRLEDVDQDFGIQGEYLGLIGDSYGNLRHFGMQVAAHGDGQFVGLGYRGGLPGNGWDKQPISQWKGTRDGNETTLTGEWGRATIQSGQLTLSDDHGTPLGTLQRVRRISDSLGKAPPADAIVLFDGSDVSEFKAARTTEEGLLIAGSTTNRNVRDFQLHLEFRTPYMPYARGQGRGNSGVYIQQRYEVQILDSFGTEPLFNGCAALYRQQPPELNMSFPPLTWQTYDIYFTAARFDINGEKLLPARVTVLHNGITVHNGRVLPTKTGAGKPEGADDRPLHLQFHGNPVYFQNVWIRLDDPHSPKYATP
jgi:hypothetical protein